MKFVLAMVGAGAVLAMGALTVAVSDDRPGRDATAAASADRNDDTSTETKVTGVPETSVAVPPITTPPYTIPTGEPQ
ncbi:MAG TPA: hypothetical protein VHH12_00335, partial [Mycobacterium sp.]|nr:hypothetical protein [Mycobacterium sp.]